MKIQPATQSALRDILSQFAVTGPSFTITPFGNGHIHQTYHAKNQETNQPDYLLQQINHQVFREVAGMMENIAKITNWQKNKDTQPLLQFISTKKNKTSFLVDSQNNHWRVFRFFNQLKAYDVPENNDQIYAAAHAFGAFVHQLSDFPSRELHQTIPKFHDLFHRLEELSTAVAKNQANRVTSVPDLLKKAQQLAPKLTVIQSALDAGDIPLRVTHNDTKFNNVLLSDDLKTTCVIDLDTVMPGAIHFDYGDGLRTSATTAKEDEADLELIHIDPARFRTFSAGYLSGLGDILTEKEKALLPLAAPMMSFIMSIRFLTDYLNGDQYYTIKYPTHNLVRARAQLHLTEQFLAFN